MIQSNELRINNLVLCRGEVSVIKLIAEKYVCLLIEPCVRFTRSAYLKEIEPIPLTEEWLSKMGFDKLYEDHYEKDGVTLMKVDKEYYFLQEDRSNFSHTYKSVSQLQNLFFSLVGKELKIEL